MNPYPLLLLFAATALAATLPAQEPSFVDAYLQEARDDLAQDRAPAALAKVHRALEREARHLGALRLLSEIAEQIDDPDLAVHSWHRWFDLVDQQAARPLPRKELDALRAHLLELDPQAKGWSRLQAAYVKGLDDLGKQYQKRKDWLGALEAYQHLLQVEPDNKHALTAIRTVRRSGGREVAVADVYAGGGDPLAGMTSEDLARLDAAHATWETAWEKETDNYRYRTNAGRVVLETSSIAMEQMNKFYRRFFQFKEDGGNTPKIEIRIFKSRDEYLSLGQSPAEWSAGHFIGSAVETYVGGGASGEADIRSMYRTLFHEAAHQFVQLTGPFVPGWLNEAYASFFEGCVILSNGTVRWNQAPPGRLFPLAQRLEAGWMQSVDEAAGANSSPSAAPPFRMVVSGQYEWGPPWYAPTWGVVYFLYNFRGDDGQPVYRDALHAYYKSFVRGEAADPVAHFEETVLAASPLSPVQRIDELDPIWKAWIIELRDIETGRKDVGDRLVQFAQAALERDDESAALEFYLEALEDRPDDPELLWATAELLAKLDQKPLAAARYRQFKRLMELEGATDDPRYDRASVLIPRLDPLTRAYSALKVKLAEDGLALARSYADRGLPTMALEIARRMSANYSVPEALDFYRDLATRTGKSLARWRVAYNERDLDGWSGAGTVWDAYGKVLRAGLTSGGGGPNAMNTAALTCDVTFDGDFSLEAGMRIEKRGEDAYAGRLVGLCFGRKGEEDFHAVLLHPTGFLDVVSKLGGQWEMLDHRTATVGDAWHTLRIDVSGADLDIYLDGLYVRSLEFASEAALRGGFGLIAGDGEASFRDVRILPRDPYDPAARIEREIAMQRVAADASLRQEGTFAGFAAPEIAPSGWVHGEPTTLEALRDKPVMLVFWSPRVENVIPCRAWFLDAHRRFAEAGLEVVVVCDAGTDAAIAAADLAAHPLPVGMRVALDQSGATYDAYYVKAGFHGMPRVVLVDRAGKVVFEGDPGLKSGAGWQPGDPPTYVDGPLQKLMAKKP